MRWVVIACAFACACNRVFDLGEVIPRDAQFFDGLGDAAHLCPPPGTMPEFSPIVHQAISQDCRGYTIAADTGVAVARCHDPDGYFDVYQAGVDRQLVRSTGAFPVQTPDLSIDNPKLSPEGDLLIVPTFDLTNIVSTYRTYHPAPDGSWIRGADLNLPQFGGFSVPSRGPDRHVIYYDGSTTAQEWHDGGTTTWTHVRDVAFASNNVRGVWLSPDGLRLLAATAPNAATTLVMMYADRQAITDPFGTTAPIPLPGSDDAFITEDCTRLYMSSVHTIFYALEK